MGRLKPNFKVDTPLLVVGFPMGFHDTLHHLPVVRQAVIASSFGLRFQGQGFFLTDARTHRGTSGATVVMRDAAGDASLPWKLLGVHSARLDMSGGDIRAEESLGLNCAWYADILLTLTADDAREKAPLRRLPPAGRSKRDITTALAPGQPAGAHVEATKVTCPLVPPRSRDLAAQRKAGADWGA